MAAAGKTRLLGPRPPHGPGLDCWATNLISTDKPRTDRARKWPRGAAISAGLALTLCCSGWLGPATAGATAGATSLATAGEASLATAGATAMAVAATTTTVTAPAQTQHGGEFLSPSGNISCEIDNGYIDLHQVYCQTISPPESVVLVRTGTFKVCKGQQCLGNPAINTPVLAYGHSTGSGPFHCLSTTAGVTCTIAGKGFEISRAGIKAVHTRISS